MALHFSRNASSPAKAHAKPFPRAANYRSRATQFRLAAIVFAIMAAIVGVDRLAVRRVAKQPAATTPTTSSVETAPSIPESAATRAYRAGWAEVYGGLREDEKALLFRVLGFTRRSEAWPAEAAEMWPDTQSRLDLLWQEYLTHARSTVEGGSDLSPDERAAWSDVIEQADRRAKKVLSTLGGAERTSESLIEAQAILDDIALAEIRDDTVYRHAEKEIWFRLIEKVQKPDDAPSATAVDYIPLHRQSEQYRGRAVRVRGWIELAYRVAAPINDLGVKSYYIFWLRPATGAAKPIVVYALELPQELAWRENGKQSAAPRAQIECAGYFFKRLAYRSGKGIDTAPLVVAGRPLVLEGAAAPVASASSGGWKTLAAIVVVAAILAIAATLFVFRRTRSTRRSATLERIALVFVFSLIPNLPSRAQSLGELPWKSPEAATSEGDSWREAFVGIDETQLVGIRDGQPLSPEERETLLQTLYRLPRIGVARWERRLKESPPPPLAELSSAGAEYRLAPFQLSGRAIKIARRQLSRGDAERYEFPVYYEAKIAIEGTKEIVLVAARSAPTAWLDRDSLDERVAVRGVFFKVLEEAGEETPLFAAERIEWLPDKVDPSLGIEQSHIALADLGMDIGLFADVPSENGQGIGVRDSDCFRALLKSAGRADEAKLSKGASPAFDIGAVLSHPEREHGRLYALRFKARRITRVLANESERGGNAPSYYQIDGFLPLGDQVVQLDSPSTKRPGGESPKFRDNFPATICVSEIPAGLLKPNESSCEVNLTLLANAFFFKLWTYRSSYISQFDPAGRQPSPLFVGRSARLAPAGAAPKRHLGAAAAIAFVLALVALGIGSRFLARSDRLRTGELRRRFENDPSGPIGPPR